jgi:RecA-family ATPase
LRLPGTTNLPNAKKRKQGRAAYPTELLWFDGAGYPLDAFPITASIKTDNVSLEPGVDLDDPYQYDSHELVENDVEQGKRSSHFHSVVCTLLEREWSRDDILALLQRHPKGIAARYTKEKRLADMVDYSIDMWSKKQSSDDVDVNLPTVEFIIKPKPEPPELQSMFLEELQTQPVVPREWTVKDLIIAEAVNGLFGDGGTGKDLILFQLAIAKTCGAQWLGHDVEQGRVMYFTTEDSIKELRRREDAITAYYDRMGMYNPVPKQLKIFPLLGKDTILATYESKKGLVRPTPLFSTTCKQIEEFKPTLVIVGNRVNIFAVNQNDDSQARQCVSLLSAICLGYNTTVIMPGHVSLSSQRTGEGTSGTVQWSNAMRQRLYLRRIKDTEDGKEVEPDPNMRELEVMKANYAPTGTIVSLEWSEGLFKSDNAKVKQQSREEEVEQQSKDEDEFMCMLDSLVGKQHVSSYLNAPNYAPTYFSKDSVCRLRGHKGKERLAAAMQRLHRKGIIDTVTEGPPSRERSRIVRKKGTPGRRRFFTQD